MPVLFSSLSLSSNHDTRITMAFQVNRDEQVLNLLGELRRWASIRNEEPTDRALKDTWTKLRQAWWDKSREVMAGPEPSSSNAHAAAIIPDWPRWIRSQEQSSLQLYLSSVYKKEWDEIATDKGTTDRPVPRLRNIAERLGIDIKRNPLPLELFLYFDKSVLGVIRLTKSLAAWLRSNKDISGDEFLDFLNRKALRRAGTEEAPPKIEAQDVREAMRGMFHSILALTWSHTDSNGSRTRSP